MRQNAVAAGQISLFDDRPFVFCKEEPVAIEPVEAPPPVLPAPVVRPEARISEVLSAYEFHLKTESKSRYTVEAFTTDMRLFGEESKDPSISSVSTETLEHYLGSLRKAAPKTLYRKVTTFKNFFGWLQRGGKIPTDPALPLAYSKVKAPLPEILTTAEAESFFEASRHSVTEHALALLLLGAGLKRGELRNLERHNIDIKDPLRPTATVSPENRDRKRVVDLPLDFAPVYEKYLSTRADLRKDMPFAFDERYLNDVLKAIADRAGITDKRVSCQILRDTFGTQCVKAGEKIEVVLGKLGLAPSESNDEARRKYQRLAEITP